MTVTRFRFTTLGALVALLVGMFAGPALGQETYPPPPPPDEPPTEVGGVGFEVVCPADDGDPIPQLRWSVTDDELDIDEDDLTANVFFTDGDESAEETGVPFADGRVLWPDTELDGDGNPITLPGFTRDADGNWIEGDLDAFPRGEVIVTFSVDGLPEDDDTQDFSALRDAELGVTYPFDEACDPEPVDPETDVEDETEEELEIEDADEDDTDVLGVTIPRTGAELLMLLAVGATLLLGGTMVLLVRRRRSDPAG